MYTKNETVKIKEKSYEELIIDDYRVGIFFIKIFDTYPEVTYQAMPLICEETAKIMKKIAKTVVTTTKLQDRIYKLNELLEIIKKEATILWKKLTYKRPYIFRDEDLEEILLLTAYQVIGMAELTPLLMDRWVNEIYLDNPKTPIYIDHLKWGRCKTKTYLTRREIEKIVTRIRIENDLVLKYTNPSIKGELVTKNFHARVTIDAPPLAIDGFHIDIRKLRKKPYTLPELIANKTVTLEAAAYIYYCLINRCNITVIGEPGAGKTTMINALDLLTPHIWRKIVIEDAIESVPQTEYGFHQLRLKCGKQDLEEKNGNKIYDEKSREIAKLLHRSPDWVYLGEILYPEDARAMFHALSAGLKGLQTCHGETPENVIIRWVIHHKIPAVALQPLDLILHMKKIVEKREIKRKLVQICEIKDVIDINRQENGEKIEENEKTGKNQERGEKIIELPDQKVVLVDTFQYSPKTNQAERVIKNLFMTPTLEKIKRYSYVKEERFKETLQKLEKTLKNLTLTKTFNIKQVKNSLLKTIGEGKEIS